MKMINDLNGLQLSISYHYKVQKEMLRWIVMTSCCALHCANASSIILIGAYIIDLIPAWAHTSWIAVFIMLDGEYAYS